MATIRPLDNPIYNALLTEHAVFSMGTGLARRFPAEIAPFGGLDAGGELDLLNLFALGEQAILVGGQPERLDGWEVVKGFEVIQFVHASPSSVPLREPGREPVQLLSEDDLAAMLTLTSLAYPSYFRAGTARLGDYCGIYEGPELIAMAGVRMRRPGFEEISAICTHPDHRGRGLGSAVTRFMIDRIVSRVNTPFLHTESDNPAQLMYRKLGFEDRTLLPVQVLRRVI
ncbi:MAG: GNAT family N-acetyltransferase [Fimbriimonas sp.]